MGAGLLHTQPQGSCLEVQPAKLSDCLWLCSEVRQADRDEVRAATGGTVLHALVEGLQGSRETWTARLGKTPIAMFGVAPIPLDPEVRYGAVWLLGSDRIQEVRYTFLRESRPWLERLEQGFDLVGNVVDARNTIHIRWLRWLGFSFIREIPHFGHEKRPFYEFLKRV